MKMVVSNALEEQAFMADEGGGASGAGDGAEAGAGGGQGGDEMVVTGEGGAAGNGTGNGEGAGAGGGQGGDEMEEEEDGAETDEEKWVECDLCERWRRVPGGENYPAGGNFFCTMMSGGSCDIPEETDGGDVQHAAPPTHRWCHNPSQTDTKSGAVQDPYLKSLLVRYQSWLGVGLQSKIPPIQQLIPGLCRISIQNPTQTDTKASAEQDPYVKSRTKASAGLA